ncbi:MAG: HAMP domain-containing methyl-accepting chemotaxis protein [Sporomusaceae bacterium]|nr:HAMP domain-containing methyl-accepting chemotaxis protein [Sporomusaceae bacterium]
MGNRSNSLLWAPGIKVMQKFKFLHKILILISIILIPIIMLSYFFHVEIKKVTDFATAERNGIKYILPLSEVLIELTEGVSPDFNSQKIDEQIKIIDENNAMLGSEFKVTDSWSELKGLLKQHTPGTRQTAIDKTLEIIAKVGDNSGLVLDPDIDSYYVMDVAIVKYPDILKKTNQIVSLAIADLGKTSRTMNDQLEMAMVVGAIHSTLDGAKIGVQTAVKANDKLKDGITVFNESEAATINLLKQIDNTLIKTSSIAERTGNSQEISKQLKLASGKNAIAYRSFLQQLDELIVNRIDGVKSHERNIFIVMFFTLLVAVYLLVALYLSMEKAIREIFVGTQKLAGGDWRDTISISSADEFADIANSLNTVREEIRPLIGELLHSSHHVADASQEITASSEKLAQFANQMSLSVSRVANGAGRQLQAVNQSIKAIEKMSENIQQVAANTSLATHSSQKTADEARTGSQTITIAMEQMRNIEIAVMDSANVIRNLGEHSQEIGQIVDTISGIAGQTNLLALNAAIEAARAGEQGRGFAVVADEVRKLAEQSQEATKQIAQLIAQIQSGTSSAVESMKAGTTVVTTGTEVVNNAGKAFNEIVGLIYQVSGQIHEISEAIQNIVSDNQAIMSTTNEIATTSEDAVSQTQNVLAASEEQSASMQTIASSTQTLAKLSEELRSVVSFFKV